MAEENQKIQEKIQSQENLIENPKNKKKEFIKFGIIFVLIVLVIFSSVLIYKKYKQNKFNQQQLENYQNYLNWEKRYEEAMKNDTYGGKTPEETLQMFIEALQKEDIELASKYFALKDDGTIDQKWINLLNKVKNENKLRKMADDLKNYNEAKKTFDPYYIFLYHNKDGSIGLQINMIFNKFSGVWKIESM